MNGQEHLEARIEQLERRLKHYEYSQRALEGRIAAIENSLIYRILRRIGKPLLDAETKAAKMLGRPAPSFPGAMSYQAWVQQESETELPALESAPSFALLVAYYGQPREWLETTVAAVRAQRYPSWSLCICHDESPEPWLAEYLVSVATADRRVQITRAAKSLGTANALNEAAALSPCDYVMVLSPGDRPAPAALDWLASAAPAELIYSDEDALDSKGERVDPVFKPGWSPDLLLSSMYLGRLMAVSRAAWQSAGGFRKDLEGAEEYDLALRITDRPAAVRHVPRVLCHRPKAEAGGAADPASVRKALEDAIERRGYAAEAESAAGGVRWKTSGPTLASLIICSRSPGLLERCLETIAGSTAWPHREVIVVHHLGPEDAALKAAAERFGAVRVPYSGPFHFSLMNNIGAQAARGEVLVFLNDDVEPLESSWLERLVAQAERPDVGVVGAKLLYPSGSLQHAGVVVGISDGCGHVGRGVFDVRYWPWLEMTRDVAAVTGACMAMRAAVFHEIGGFSNEFPVNYNDTDLCLRARQAGYRVICDVGALLQHLECQTRSRGVTFRERERWYIQWGELMEAGDQFYTSHLTREGEDLTLRVVAGG